MRKLLGFTLGLLTAIGGFLDIGDIVTNAVAGSRFGFALVWVVPLGVIGICLFADMAGRVAAVSGRSTFEIIRERLGPRLAAGNLVASFLVTALTLIAEIGGMALALQLASGVAPLLWVPVAAFVVWLILWRVKFSVMENVSGLLGLCMAAFGVAFFLVSPPLGEVWHEITHPAVPSSESVATYWYYAVALFGAAMTPYEVFFFSSGGIEERWSRKDLRLVRVNVLLGFPLGGLGAIAITALAAVTLNPAGISVETLSQVVLPVAAAGGQLLLAFAIAGLVAVTAGAALETALSSGYMVAQYAGWPWGAAKSPSQAPRFHVVIMFVLVCAVGVLMTGVDPIMLTEASVVFSAAALPLTYLPILVVANDREYMGEHVNGRFTNALGSIYLVLVCVVAAASIPLLIWTGMGR